MSYARCMSPILAGLAIAGVAGLCGFNAGWHAGLGDHSARMARIRLLSARKSAIQRGERHPSPGEWSPLLRAVEAERARERGRSRSSECLEIHDDFESVVETSARRARADRPGVRPRELADVARGR